MPDTYITESEVFTLGESFRNFIKKLKNICPGCEAAQQAEEYAVIDKDNDVIAINATIKELEKRLTKAASLAKSGPR